MSYQKIIKKCVFSGVSFKYDNDFVLLSKTKKYMINDKNIDLYNCLTNILINSYNNNKSFLYTAPSYLLNRTFIQSDMGCRWTLRNTKSKTVEDSYPIRYIEKKIGYDENEVDDENEIYRVMIKKMSDIPCIRLYEKKQP